MNAITASHGIHDIHGMHGMHDSHGMQSGHGIHGCHGIDGIHGTEGVYAEYGMGGIDAMDGRNNKSGINGVSDMYGIIGISAVSGTDGRTAGERNDILLTDHSYETETCFISVCNQKGGNYNLCFRERTIPGQQARTQYAEALPECVGKRGGGAASAGRAAKISAPRFFLLPRKTLRERTADAGRNDDAMRLGPAWASKERFSLPQRRILHGVRPYMAWNGHGVQPASSVLTFTAGVHACFRLSDLLT